jgi:hypothetical protein
LEYKKISDETGKIKVEWCKLLDLVCKTWFGSAVLELLLEESVKAV